MADVSNFTIDGVAITVKDNNAVSILANQGLTDNEKANARTNIGAGDSSFSGDYNDLANKPTIPIVNNATLTIQKNGTNVQTFTANSSSNKTANITVPTKTSELTNDSGYITDAGVTGVKGDSETNYRTGNVNITKSNIGLGNVPNVSTNNQKPTFTQASSRANIASGETLTTIFGKLMKWYADLKTVAFSGSYSDLSNKPTIPTVNNATLTIQKNGTNVQTFTANASSNKTANITVPTTSILEVQPSTVACTNQVWKRLALITLPANSKATVSATVSHSLPNIGCKLSLGTIDASENACETTIVEDTRNFDYHYGNCTTIINNTSSSTQNVYANAWITGGNGNVNLREFRALIIT